MGSSRNQWERALKLVSSSLQLVTSGARTAKQLADHLQLFVFTPPVAQANDTIIRHATVMRSLAPQAALDATGRKQYVNKDVVKTMPCGDGTEVDVHFFPIKRYASPAEVAEAYAAHNLKPDPIAQARVNADDPSFADDHPNACQWQDAEGRWCYAPFDRWRDERNVNVNRDDNDWHDDWWFGGVRNSLHTRHGRGTPAVNPWELCNYCFCPKTYPTYNPTVKKVIPTKSNQIEIFFFIPI